VLNDLKVYVGYDAREDEAWEVCRHSIQIRSPSTQVCAIRQNQVRDLGLYNRAEDSNASTDFSLTRFLAPYLAAHDGWTIFADCDFVFTADITNCLDGLDAQKAVHVVKHIYEPHYQNKMDGKPQHAYPRKNWSSFMIFNGSHPTTKRLTPEYVNNASPADLHRFAWTNDEAEIGSLDVKWNFLVGEYPKPSQLPYAIHFTNGGPWFSEWQNVDYADIWKSERDSYKACKARGLAKDPDEMRNLAT